MQRTRNFVLKSVSLIAILFVVYIVLLIVITGVQSSSGHNLFFLLAVAVVGGAVYLYKKYLRRVSFKPIISLAVILFVGMCVRLVVIYIFRDVVPLYDAANYLEFAGEFFSGIRNVTYISVFPHYAGYPAFLAVAMKITGMRMGAVWALNLAADAGIICLLFLMTKKLGGKPLIPALIYALLPSSILFVAFPNSELLFGLLLLTMIYLLILAVKTDGKLAYACMVGTAVTLALANAVRPFGIIVLIAIVILMVFPLRKKLRFVVIPVVYFAMAAAITFSISQLIGREVAATPIGWNIFDGLSVEGKGRWNQADNNVFNVQFGMVRDEEMPANELHKYFIDKSFERLKEQGADTLQLLYVKPVHMWGRDTSSLDLLDAMHKLDNNRIFSDTSFDITAGVVNGYYAAIILLFLHSLCAKPWKDDDHMYLFLLLLFCAVFTIHLIVEVSPRYHYYSLLVMILAATRIHHRHSPPTEV